MKKTVGTPQEIKGVVSLTYFPLYLLTREARVRSISDFISQDKIAMPAAKVGNQALLLQIAAAKAFGIKNYDRLDPLTVSMSLPNATVALLSGRSEVTAHFSAPPFQFQELRQPGVRKLLDSRDVFDGPLSTLVVVASKRFRDENPKVYEAWLKAAEEAMNVITTDKEYAADVYVRATGGKGPVAEILEILQHPDVKFTGTPAGIYKSAEFMHSVGRLRKKPDSWKDLFFPEIHTLPGS